MKVDEGILGGQGLELVGSSFKVISSLDFQIFCDLLSKALKGVEASTNGGTTLSNLIDVLQCLFDTHMAITKLVHITREFLTKSQRSGILSMGSADLDNIIEFGSLSIKYISKGSKLRE